MKGGVLMDDKTFYNSLSKNERIALNNYKCNSPFNGVEAYAYSINSFLRGNIPLDDIWEKQKQYLDNTINKYSSPSEITLFRGTDDREINVEQGFVAIVKSYMSTSTDEDEARRFLDEVSNDHITALLEIECPKGSKMALMEGREEYGFSEGERLLPRNCRFVVIEKEEIKILKNKYITKIEKRLNIFNEKYFKYKLKLLEE